MSEQAIAAVVASIGVVNLVVNGALQKGTWPASLHLSKPWRVGIVATLAAVAGAATVAAQGGVSSWSEFGAAFGMAVLAAVPGIVREWMQAIVAGATLLLVLSLGGCAGSFEESRLAGGKLRAAPPSARCIALDDSHRTWGGIAKGTAFAAGSAGIGTIPVGDATTRLSVAIGAAVLGTAAAASVFVSEDYATTWARECGQ